MAECNVWNQVLKVYTFDFIFLWVIYYVTKSKMDQFTQINKLHKNKQGGSFFHKTVMVLWKVSYCIKKSYRWNWLRNQLILERTTRIKTWTNPLFLQGYFSIFILQTKLCNKSVRWPVIRIIDKKMHTDPKKITLSFSFFYKI